MIDLHGERVLVIGGSSGMGAAIARLAYECGAAVTIASRNQERLDAVAATIGSEVDTAELDVSDERAMADFFGAASGFHHIVVTAAGHPRGSVADLSVNEVSPGLDVRFWGAYFT